MAGATAVLSGLVVSHASASNLGDLQAQAQAIEARISALGSQENALSERYDAANLALRQVQAKVAAARAEVGSAMAKADGAEKVVREDAVNAYVSSGSGSVSGSGPASTLAGADGGLLRAEYEQTLATNQTDSEDRYELASKTADTAETNLRVEEAAATANVKAIAGDEKQVRAAAASLVATESEDKGRIATLIAQQQAAEARAEHAAALQRLAAERAAQAAQQAAAARQAQSLTTDAPQTPTATPTTSPPVTVTPVTSPSSTSPTSTAPVTSSPPSSSAAAVAVQAAESRVGDPYVWGAAGPNAFDCSGLVMWAYAQAGVSLPHYSGAQYADTIHISMADLEPGDIVFFANPGIHEAMYIGNGEVVQAPYTGADVQIVPMYSQFVLAGRVA